MSDSILKDKDAAFQRWEMRSFGESRTNARTASTAAKVSIEEIAQIREQARAKGRAEGMAEGRAEGLAQGRAEAARELENLRSIAEQLAQEAARADEAVAKDMLDLALDLTRAMLKTSLAVKPELVLPVVGEAIRYLPSLQQPALLHLNPQDAAIVKSQMDDELNKAGWRVVEDVQISRGGCRIETASNQIDATIQTRWQRLVEALGRNSEWIE